MADTSGNRVGKILRYGLIAIGGLLVWRYAGDKYTGRGRLPISAAPIHERPQSVTPTKASKQTIEVNVFPYSVCEATVKKHLKAPDTAEFPGLLERAKPTDDPDGSRVWHGWARSKNLMGVVVRNEFTCVYKPGEDVVRVTFDDPR